MAFQFGLFADVDPPESESEVNRYGVLSSIEVLELPGGQENHGRSLAEIRLAYLAGVYHFAVSVEWKEGGVGYAPAEKWGRVAEDRPLAIARAAEEIRAYTEKAVRNRKQARKIEQWLRSISI